MVNCFFSYSFVVVFCTKEGFCSCAMLFFGFDMCVFCERMVLEKGIKMEKEYFFETDFVKLSWDDILRLYPDAKYCFVDGYGNAFVSAEKPFAVVSGWYGNRIHIARSPGVFDNWEDLIFEAPEKEKFVEEWPRVDIEDVPERAAGWAWDRSGQFYFYEKKPVIALSFFVNETLNDNSMRYGKYDIEGPLQNWKESWHDVPKQVTQEIWDAIELLCGKKYRWIAMNKLGSCFAFMQKPELHKFDGFFVSDVCLPSLKNFFPDWKTSVRKKP